MAYGYRIVSAEKGLNREIDQEVAAEDRREPERGRHPLPVRRQVERLDDPR